MPLCYMQALVSRDQFDFAQGEHTTEYGTVHAWFDDGKYGDAAVALFDELRADSWTHERTIVWPVAADKYASRSEEWFRNAMEQARTTGKMVVFEVAGSFSQRIGDPA